MTEQNPIVRLSKLVQKLYGASIETEVVSKTGPDHDPTITATITLPNGEVFEGVGYNKRVAKQNAAYDAIEWINKQ